MQIKQIEVYKIDELTLEAQEKARQDYNSDNDYPFLSDCMNEKLHELLEENKVKDLNDTSKAGMKPTQVLYSLSYSQGDGVMFAGSFEWKKYTIYIKHSGNYYHSNSKFIEIHETDNLGIDIGDDYELKVYAKFEVIYQKICKELEQFGYRFMEEEDSMEHFKETCEINDYTFELSGKRNNL